jgi:hypothetical protein
MCPSTSSPRTNQSSLDLIHVVPFCFGSLLSRSGPHPHTRRRRRPPGHQPQNPRQSHPAATQTSVPRRWGSPIRVSTGRCRGYKYPRARYKRARARTTTEPSHTPQRLNTTQHFPSSQHTPQRSALSRRHRHRHRHNPPPPPQ